MMAQQTDIRQRMPLRILQIGPSLHQRGGISTVIRLLLNNPPVGVRYRHVGTYGNHGRFLQSVHFLIALPAILLAIGPGRPDLVHIHFAERGSFVRKVLLSCLCLLLGKRFILHGHCAEYEKFHASMPSWFMHASAAILTRSQLLIALGNAWREAYIRLLGFSRKRTTALLNPAVPLPHRPPIVIDKVAVVSLGMLGQRKGTFDLIHAISLIPKNVRSGLHVTIAGNGDTEQAKALVRELQLEDTIDIPGWVEGIQREILMAQAHVFVLPSYHEGLPMAMLEAMARRLACIVTPVGCIPEVIENRINGILVEPGDQPALTAAIIELITKDELRHYLGEQAGHWVTTHGIDSYLIRLRALYVRGIYNSCR